MRYLWLAGIAIIATFGCGPRSAADMSAAEKTAIAESLKRLVVSAYDLSKPDPVKSLMSLYPTEGRVVSASGGVVTTTRPQLEQGIKAFWTYVGQNMRSPKWEWTSMNVDVHSGSPASCLLTLPWVSSILPVSVIRTEQKESDDRHQ